MFPRHNRGISSAENLHQRFRRLLDHLGQQRFELVKKELAARHRARSVAQRQVAEVAVTRFRKDSFAKLPPTLSSHAHISSFAQNLSIVVMELPPTKQDLSQIFAVRDARSFLLAERYIFSVLVLDV